MSKRVLVVDDSMLMRKMTPEKATIIAIRPTATNNSINVKPFFIFQSLKKF